MFSSRIKPVTHLAEFRRVWFEHCIVAHPSAMYFSFVNPLTFGREGVSGSTSKWRNVFQGKSCHMESNKKAVELKICLAFGLMKLIEITLL
jgi:hypothetical protein